MSSEENQKEEQITIEPEQKVEKVKNPAKVAAGQRLAEYHKKAKAALLDKDKPKDKESSWFPDISFATAVGVVGIGLTAVDLYFRLRKTPEQKKYEPRLNTIKESNEPKPVIVNLIKVALRAHVVTPKVNKVVHNTVLIVLIVK